MNNLNYKYFDEEGDFENEKLDTEEKMYSFLLGVYLRYGEQLKGNIYQIHISSSAKNKVIYQVLKELECDKIVYKYLRDFLPSLDIFYFQATPRMIKYFNEVEREKEELQKAFYQTFYEKL